MARNVTIQINDHNAPGVCTSFYSVRLRLTAIGGFTQLPNQYGDIVGSPAYYAVVLDNLDDDVEYECGITRHCCEGTESGETLVTFTTTP